MLLLVLLLLLLLLLLLGWWLCWGASAWLESVVKLGEADLVHPLVAFSDQRVSAGAVAASLWPAQMHDDIVVYDMIRLLVFWY